MGEPRSVATPKPLGVSGGAAVGGGAQDRGRGRNREPWPHEKRLGGVGGSGGRCRRARPWRGRGAVQAVASESWRRASCKTRGGSRGGRRSPPPTIIKQSARGRRNVGTSRSSVSIATSSSARASASLRRQLPAAADVAGRPA